MNINVRQKLWSFIKAYIYIPAAIVVALILGGVIFIFGVIPSGSMEPTYPTGSFFAGNRLVDKDTLARGTPAIFHFDDTVYFKRIIGTGGDIITFHDGKVYINGEQLDESEYISPDIQTNPSHTESFTVPDGHYFMLGDNRLYSYDSRDWPDPFVPCDDIIAVPLVVFQVPFFSSLYN